MLARSFYRYNSSWPWRQVRQPYRFAGSATAPRLRVGPRFPALNVWTNEDRAVATVRLPGVDPEQLDISVENDTITISGSRDPQDTEDKALYLRRELRYGKFSRTFQLPFQVDADAVEAHLENGILTLSLPQSEADKPKKIVVQST